MGANGGEERVSDSNNIQHSTCTDISELNQTINVPAPPVRKMFLGMKSSVDIIQLGFVVWAEVCVVWDDDNIKTMDDDYL